MVRTSNSLVMCGACMSCCSCRLAKRLLLRLLLAGRPAGSHVPASRARGLLSAPDEGGAHTAAMATPSQRIHLLDLPDECLELVAGHLSHRKLLALSQVNKRLRDISVSPGRCRVWNTAQRWVLALDADSAQSLLELV